MGIPSTAQVRQVFVGPHSIFSSRDRTRFNLLRLISNSVVADDLELLRFLSPPFKYWCTRHKSDFTPCERLHTQFMLSQGSNPGHHTGGKALHQLALPHHPHGTVSRECGCRRHARPQANNGALGNTEMGQSARTLCSQNWPGS